MEVGHRVQDVVFVDRWVPERRCETLHAVFLVLDHLLPGTRKFVQHLVRVSRTRFEQRLLVSLVEIVIFVPITDGNTNLLLGEVAFVETVVVEPRIFLAFGDRTRLANYPTILSGCLFGVGRCCTRIGTLGQISYLTTVQNRLAFSLLRLLEVRGIRMVVDHRLIRLLSLFGDILLVRRAGILELTDLQRIFDFHFG